MKNILKFVFLFLLMISFSAVAKEAENTSKKEGVVKFNRCAYCAPDKLCKLNMYSNDKKCPHCCDKRKENGQERRQNFNQQ